MHTRCPIAKATRCQSCGNPVKAGEIGQDPSKVPRIVRESVSAPKAKSYTAVLQRPAIVPLSCRNAAFVNVGKRRGFLRETVCVFFWPKTT